MSSTTITVKEALLNDARQSLGEDTISTIEPTTINQPAPSPAIIDQKATCITQKPIPRNLRAGPAHLMVGWNAECPRWTPGSVVKWAAWRMGFDSQEDANYAALQLAVAAQHWNSKDVGMRFEWVGLAKDATFIICHGGDNGNVLASSFFPNANDLNYFYVYSGCFRGAWKDNMWRVFTHELGHILGLRHEFAMSPDPNVFEGEAVQLGPQNPKSVMNYTLEPPEIQQTDVESTKVFYSLKHDAGGKAPMVGLTEVRDYVPS